MTRNWRRRDVLMAGSSAIGLPALALFDSSYLARAEGQSRETEIRFRDLVGDEIVLPAPAQRIVDLWTTGAGFAIAAHGSPSRLVGINDRARSIFERGVIGRLFPEVLDLPSDVLVGNGAPNIERLVNLNPDLIVDMRDDPRDLAAVMRHAGLTVARYRHVEGGIRGSIKALLAMFGQMIGDTSRAERIIAVMNETDSRLAKVQAIPHSERQSALIIMPLGDSFYVSGGDASDGLAELIYSAGATNAAASLPGLSVASPEQLAAWDPDMILIFQSEGASPELIYRHPVLGSGKAAAARRVYLLPIGTNNWGSMGPDEFLAEIWLAELLYPDRMEYTLRDDMRRAYATIFERSFSEDEIDNVLRTDLNGGSVHYERFLREA